MSKKKKEKIEDILERGTEDIISEKNLRKKLLSGKNLRIKLGVDPTGPKIHLGRASQFWKLRAFQELGHHIILIIGDFTAQIGDASDKQTMRDTLTKEEIEKNMKNYEEQIGKILDMNKVELHYNSEWLGKMKIQKLISISMNFTAQQLIQRRNFKKRWGDENPIGLHELNYPLLQGYDSVAIDADVELGGFDQLFNLKIGRKMQELHGQEPQDIMTTTMIYGLDGRKMSTSWGNVITIVDDPKEMYGKIMSMKDELIYDYFKLCAFYSQKELKRVKKELKKKNPKELKKELARAIVALYYDKEKTKKAEKEFEKVFEKGGIPEDIMELVVKKEKMGALNLVDATGLVDSKSQAKRLLKQGAVQVDNEKIKGWKEDIKIRDEMIIKIGKKRFAKVIKK